MSAQTITNRLRVLAIANNTKTQYPGSIAQSSPFISTINSNKTFDKLRYNLFKKKCCFPSIEVCKIPRFVNGGTPSSVPLYFVNGGVPTSNASCYVNSGTPFNISCGNSLVFPSGPPYNANDVDDYFIAMDSLLFTCDFSEIVIFHDIGLARYYNYINSETRFSSPFYLFRGTTFPLDSTDILGGINFLVPSSYPIYIGGVSFQTIGRGVNAILSIGGIGIPVGTTYLLNGVAFKFLGGGSPGGSIRLSNDCYSDLLLDGGVIVETQNIEIDGGTPENDTQKCNIDGKEI